MGDRIHNKGLVLKVQDYKEAAVLATLLTETGKKTFIIRGAKKFTAHTREYAQPITYLDFIQTTGYAIETMTEAAIINNYGDLKKDISLYNESLVIIEKVLHFADTVKNYNKLYELVLKYFDLINNNDVKLLTLLLEIKILYLMGVTPNLTTCTQCGSPITKSSLSIICGGAVCSNCHVDDINMITDEYYVLYNTLLYTKIDNYQNIIITNKDLNVLSNFIDKYFEYHLEFYSKVKNVLRSIKL